MRVPQVQATYVCMRRSLARCPARFRWPFSRCVVERLGVTDFGDGASVLRWPSDGVSVTARVLTRFDACRRVSFCGALAAWRSWLALLARSWIFLSVSISLHLSSASLALTHLHTFTRTHSQASIVYYGAAVFLHYVVPFFLRRNLASVQKGRREENQVRREALASLGPLFVKSLIWSVVDWLVVVRESQEGSHESRGLASWVTVHDGEMGSVASLIGTVAVLDMLHDTWFYWTHRLLHTKALYRRVHYMHHESRYVVVAGDSRVETERTHHPRLSSILHIPSLSLSHHSPPTPHARCRVPTAFTGYSFHVLEAIIVFFNEILVCFFLPIHTRVHRYYHMYTTVIHCGGHAGYEIAPYVPSLQGLCSLLLTNGKINEYLTTVEHHDMHHQVYTIHFGLYFQIWDRLMGTGVTERAR